MPAPTPIHDDDSRLIAYLGNWQSCPTTAQTAQYTHIVIAFAVSYTWSPGKNICSSTCEIAEPPICNNAPNPTLVNQWRAAGKKVILSFGGAGMGGSWAGDQNDCWEYCYGRETQVTNRLVQIVNNMNLDGVDIDFEYHVTPAAVTFLNQITTGLKNSLPVGSEVTHAPMDADVIPGRPYYDDVLMVTGHQLDFLMPQYYNGYTRPAIDGVGGTGAGSMSALSHYTDIVNGIFGGDPKRMVFGFCISDCGGTGSNANGAQASTVMTDLADTYPCNGGAFFWVVQHDTSGSWSNPVSSTISSLATAGCSPVPTPSPVPTAPTVTPQPTSAPTKSPTPEPTQAPVSSPTTSGPSSMCCQPNENKLKAYNGCTQYYRCVWGEVQPDLVGPMSNGALFDEGIQNWNWPSLFTCHVDPCGEEPPQETPAPTPQPRTPPPVPISSPQPTAAPTLAPVSISTPQPTSAPTAAPTLAPVPISTPQPTSAPTKSPTPEPTQAPVSSPTTSGPSSMCCQPNENKLKAYNGCTQYYRCVWGEVQPDLVGPMSNGALFDEGIQNWNWPSSFTCSVDPCDGTHAPTPAPAPTGSGGDPCCPAGFSGLKAWNECFQYYHCDNGKVVGGLLDVPSGTLFDQSVQNIVWANQLDVCVVDGCARRLRGGHRK